MWTTPRKNTVPRGAVDGGLKETSATKDGRFVRQELPANEATMGDKEKACNGPDYRIRVDL